MAASARRADIAFFASLAVSAILIVLFGFVQLRIDKLGTDDFATAWAGARAAFVIICGAVLLFVVMCYLHTIYARG